LSFCETFCFGAGRALTLARASDFAGLAAGRDFSLDFCFAGRALAVCFFLTTRRGFVLALDFEASFCFDVDFLTAAPFFTRDAELLSFAICLSFAMC
jgi:hypothetical protein